MTRILRIEFVFTDEEWIEALTYFTHQEIRGILWDTGHQGLQDAIASKQERE